jgi:semaphorin 6
MSKSQIPVPRPGICPNNSSALKESDLNFIKHHPLVDWAVPTSENGPIFVQTSFEERLTVIAVDSGVRAIDESVYDILFVGTSSGRVLKVFNLFQDFGHNG